MKKLILAMMGTGLFLSCNAFAFTTPDCNNCGYNAGLAAPKFAGGFSLGVTGSWLRASSTGTGQNDLILGRADDTGIVTESFLHRFEPDHEWQWGFNVGYDFPCSSYNLELDYFHIDSKDHRNSGFDDGFDSIASFFVTNLNFPIGVPGDVGVLTPIVVVDYDVHSELKFKFDQVDLKFGRQYNDVCGYFTIKPSIGVRYAKIDDHYHARFDGSIVDAIAPVSPFIDTTIFINNHSEFDGIGPLVSLDARYGFCGGFGIVGHFDAALLAGEVDSHLNTHSDIFTLDGLDGDVLATDANDTSFHTPDTDRLVTSFTGKVGVDYSYCFCNKSSLTFEIGYQASKYYDAIDFLRGEQGISTAIIDPAFNATSQLVTHSDTNNFEFRGPYANITWHI